jgi:hypothetical protein
MMLNAPAWPSPAPHRPLLLWSRRGEVACRDHAPDTHDPRWVEEKWALIPESEQGRHGRIFQCQHCPDRRSALVHRKGTPRSLSA